MSIVSRVENKKLGVYRVKSEKEWQCSPCLLLIILIIKYIYKYLLLYDYFFIVSYNSSVSRNPFNNAARLSGVTGGPI